MPCKIKGRLGFFGRRLPRRTPVAHKLFGCVWLAALSLCGPLLEGVQSRVGSDLGHALWSASVTRKNTHGGGLVEL